MDRTYRRHPPPGLLDLPEPRGGAIDDRDLEPDPHDPLPWWDPEHCLQPEPQPPPAPILNPNPAPSHDDDIPLF